MNYRRGLYIDNTAESRNDIDQSDGFLDLYRLILTGQLYDKGNLYALFINEPAVFTLSMFAKSLTVVGQYNNQ